MSKYNKSLGNSSKNLSRKIKLLLHNLIFFYKISITTLFIVLVTALYFFPKFSDNVTNVVYKQFARNFNFRLENVFLEGHNRVSSEDIVKKLNVSLGTPILEIPINKIRNKLEKLKWIDHVIIERRLPNTLYIGVVEKIPVAVWQIKEKLYLIDITGKVIDQTGIDEAGNFIVLVGGGANHKIKSLLDLTSKVPKLFKKVVSASRVSERRWNINLSNGIEIKMPEKNEQEAWDYICSMYNEGKLSNEINSIDLRIANKVYLSRKNNIVNRTQ